MDKKTLRSNETRAQVEAAAAVRRAYDQLAQVEAELSRIDGAHTRAATRIIAACRGALSPEAWLPGDPEDAAVTRALERAAASIADALAGNA